MFRKETINTRTASIDEGLRQGETIEDRRSAEELPLPPRENQFDYQQHTKKGGHNEDHTVGHLIRQLF
jgi:hypothetical protein